MIDVLKLIDEFDYVVISKAIPDPECPVSTSGFIEIRASKGMKYAILNISDELYNDGSPLISDYIVDRLKTKLDNIQS